MPWTRYTVAIGPGNHILEWKYANQLAEGEYDNAFYIDDITVGNTYSIYRANCDGSNAELIASNVADAHYVDYGWDALPIGQYKYGISTDGGNTIAWSDCLDKDVMTVDEQDGLEATIYPNPANNQLTIARVGMKHITLVSVTGETLYEAEVDADKIALSLNEYPSGMYFIRIQGDEGIVTKKFTIAK